MSEKIMPQHLARKAILYVRQSSACRCLIWTPPMGSSPRTPSCTLVSVL